MEKEYVDRKEFDQLKEEVNEIKQEIAESGKLLLAIDKKIDVIDTKMVTTKEIDDLRLKPLEERVGNLEDIVKWIRRTIFAGLLTTITGVVVFVVKMM
jgi:septal ring factor EnvC (AmiA/AmiB activator)